MLNNPRCLPARPLCGLLTRDIATSSRLDKNQAGKYRSTVNRSQLLTYEMAQKPHHIGVRKSWLSWHSQNLEEFKQSQPLMVVHDEVIRRFIRGFFPQNVVINGEEIVIKRRGNVVYVAGFLQYSRRLDIRRIYWMFGFTEQFLSILLKQPVKLEFAFVEITFTAPRKSSKNFSLLFRSSEKSMSQLSPGSVSEEDGTTRRVAGSATPDTERSCKVCGDRANGYNFGVLTCESCKAFFRRNAVREEEIKCPFSNNCGITPASRRFCQACRLQKCFAVGMSRSWLAENKHRVNPRKRSSNPDEPSPGEEVSVPKAYLNELIRRAKRPPAFCECRCTCGFYPSGTRLVALESGKPEQQYSTHPLLPFNNYQKQDVTKLTAGDLRYQADVPGPQNLVYLPTIGSSMMLSAFSTVQPNFTSLPSSISSSSMMPFGSVVPCLRSPPDLINEHHPPIIEKCPVSSKSQTPLLSNKYLTLCPQDLNLMQELVRANEPLKAPIDLQFNDELTLMDVVKISEAALKRIVCMARDLAAFQALDIEDKKNIMKGSCSELLILRGVMAFDPNENTWKHNFSKGFKEMEVKLDVLKSCKESQHYEEHKRFLTEFNQQIQTNECVMLLLMAIVIFRPDRPNLRDTQRIRDAQNMYYGVLRRVLECEYPHGGAAQVYETLVRKLEELKHLKEGLVRIYYGFDSRQLDPLIKELFDMM
ncbi:hypothetical protein Q1695_006406 [Nippostrongylus brasiliensis]|nr:hypothetical protein Q1695_006406 [Nippostrongylus brasiliensis]